MKLPKILLVGAGGHAQSCIDVIEREGRFAIAGLVGLPHELGANVLGYPVLGKDEDLQSLLGDIKNALVTLGQIKSPEPRMHFFLHMERMGFVMQTIVSPHAYVSPHAILGAGTIIMHGAIVNAGAVVGRNCIINSCSLIEHGARIADHCHIATAVVVNGDASVGTGTFLGSRVVVRESISIGKHCLIGMGQTILTDYPDGSRIPAARDLS